jgi:hypothetical protein
LEASESPAAGVLPAADTRSTGADVPTVQTSVTASDGGRPVGLCGWDAQEARNDRRCLSLPRCHLPPATGYAAGPFGCPPPRRTNQSRRLALSTVYSSATPCAISRNSRKAPYTAVQLSALVHASDRSASDGFRSVTLRCRPIAAPAHTVAQPTWSRCFPYIGRVHWAPSVSTPASSAERVKRTRIKVRLASMVRCSCLQRSPWVTWSGSPALYASYESGVSARAPAASFSGAFFRPAHQSQRTEAFQFAACPSARFDGQSGVAHPRFDVSPPSAAAPHSLGCAQYASWCRAEVTWPLSAERARSRVESLLASCNAQRRSCG